MSVILGVSVGRMVEVGSGVRVFVYVAVGGFGVGVSDGPNVGVEV